MFVDNIIGGRVKLLSVQGTLLCPIQWGPNLSEQRVESEEWESDGGEGSLGSMRSVWHVWA